MDARDSAYLAASTRADACNCYGAPKAIFSDSRRERARGGRSPRILPRGGARLTGELRNARRARARARVLPEPADRSLERLTRTRDRLKSPRPARSFWEIEESATEKGTSSRGEGKANGKGGWTGRARNPAEVDSPSQSEIIGPAPRVFWEIRKSARLRILSLYRVSSPLVSQIK